MPFPDGRLTDDEFTLVKTKLVEMWALNGGKKPCGKCGHGPYFFHPALIGNRSDTVTPTERHTRQPTVMIYCQRCGYAEHYVARLLGVDALVPGPEVSLG